MSMTGVVRIKAYALHGSRIEAAQAHNRREKPVDNAHKDLSHLNRELIPEEQDKTFRQRIRSRLSRLQEAGALPPIRKNATGSLEVIIRANGVWLDECGLPEDGFDIDSWAEESLSWAKKVFNPADGKVSFTAEGKSQEMDVQNIYSAILHLDESTPHLHLMVLPIDERGHLNSQPYRSRAFFSTLQPSYHEAVGKAYGLSCGHAGSPAKAADIRQYHRYIKEAMEVSHPPHIPGESMEGYDARVDACIRSCHAHMRDTELRCERRINEEIAKRNVVIRDAYRALGNIDRALGGKGSKDIDQEVLHKTVADAAAYQSLVQALSDWLETDEKEELREKIISVLARQKDSPAISEKTAGYKSL